MLFSSNSVVSVDEQDRPDPDGVKRATIEKMYTGYKTSFPDTPDITAQELVDLRVSDATVVIVDVRKEKERAVSVIPGALSRAEFERRKDEFRGRRIVLYCTIGYRSGKIVKTLRAEGLDAVNLKGSILSWAHASQPLVDKNGDTKRLHVYGRKWDLAPANYEAVW